MVVTIEAIMISAHKAIDKKRDSSQPNFIIALFVIKRRLESQKSIFIRRMTTIFSVLLRAEKCLLHIFETM